MPLGTKPKCRKTNVYNNFPYKQLKQIIKTKKFLYEHFTKNIKTNMLHTF